METPCYDALSQNRNSGLLIPDLFRFDSNLSELK